MALSEQVSVQTKAEADVALRPAQPLDAATRDLLVSSLQCPPALSESYHTLRTNIELALGAGGGSVIAVAAIDDSANAALVAANLALVIAGSGDRTLLVDGDVRSPSLGKFFDGLESAGLVQLLRGDIADLRQATRTTTLPTLGVVTVGEAAQRQSGLDRYGDAAMTLLRFKNASDRVVLLLAPILASADALRLGGSIDGLVLVVGSGRTRRDNASRARTLLDRASIPVLGAVIAP